jgi:hypothetical protein
MTKKLVLNILPMKCGSMIPDSTYENTKNKVIVPPVGVQISMHIYITES